MLRFQKVTSANLIIGKLPVILRSSNCQGLFMNKFNSKSSWFEKKSLFLKGFITKKRERQKCPTCKIGLSCFYPGCGATQNEGWKPSRVVAHSLALNRRTINTQFCLSKIKQSLANTATSRNLMQIVNDLTFWLFRGVWCSV